MLRNLDLKTSNDFLEDIPKAILRKRDVIKLKMQRFKDVKVYLYSTISPEYLLGKHMLEELESNVLFPYLIPYIANTTIYNPRLVFNKAEWGIVHIVLCFEHEPRQ